MIISKKIVKITIISSLIIFILTIFIFPINSKSNLKVIGDCNLLNQINDDSTINVTRPNIIFDNNSMILNITDVYANIFGVYFNGSAGSTPEKANYSIYFDKDDSFTGISGALVDADSDANWNATVNLTGKSLSPGVYYVKCYFENNSGLDKGYSPESDRFVILGKYNITTANLTYNQATQQLNITDIQIRNSTSILNNSGVTLARWCIFYNITGSNTSYCGNLSYNTTTMKWFALNIDVSNLSEGVYFVLSYFVINSHKSVSDLNRNILKTFTVVHTITITHVYLKYTGNMTQELKLGVKANTSYQGGPNGRILISNEANVSYVIIYSNNGSSTGISGDLTWISESWNATVDVSILKEGLYNVTITVSHISDEYLANSSINTTSFEIIHSIQITIPQPVFNRGPATLDINGVIAICSYSAINYLNSTEVDLHFYKIYNSTNQFIGLSGNLTYNPNTSSWEATNISLENYTEGYYYVLIFFNTSLVPEGATQNSSNFEIIHKINFGTFKINYIGGFSQIINITEVTAESSYYPYKLLSGYNAFRTHNYSFYNKTSRMPANPPLTGELEWNGSYWNAYNVDISKLPSGEYYVVLNFADNISVNSYGNPSSNCFTVVHSINVSDPILNYAGNFKQLLNITNITCQTSYSPEGYLNSTNALNYTYYIFNDTFQISGQLTWNDNYWSAINIDVSGLQPGEYKVRCYFTSSQAGSIYTKNITFTVVHVFNITTPQISYDSTTNTLDIYGIRVYISNKQYADNNSALIFKFQIFSENNISTGIIGNLTWNSSTQRWEARDIDLSQLSSGKYYVVVNFSIYQITGIKSSNPSELFEVIKTETSVPDYSWVFVFVILILIIPFLIGFIRRLLTKKEDEK